MNREMRHWFCSIALFLGISAPAFAGLYDINKLIPDDSIIGVTDSQTISGMGNVIQDVSVTLNISGGFNGDLYGYLRLNDSPLVVLLNRVGVNDSNPDGYA